MIHTIVQKQKKARFKKERKRTFNAVKIIELNELHLNRMKKKEENIKRRKLTEEL